MLRGLFFLLARPARDVFSPRPGAYRYLRKSALSLSVVWVVPVVWNLRVLPKIPSMPVVRVPIGTQGRVVIRPFGREAIGLCLQLFAQSRPFRWPPFGNHQAFGFQGDSMTRKFFRASAARWILCAVAMALPASVGRAESLDDPNASGNTLRIRQISAEEPVYDDSSDRVDQVRQVSYDSGYSMPDRAPPRIHRVRSDVTSARYSAPQSAPTETVAPSPKSRMVAPPRKVSSAAPVEEESYEPEFVETPNFGGYESSGPGGCGCGSDCGGGCGLGCGLGCGGSCGGCGDCNSCNSCCNRGCCLPPGHWCGGADYLIMRPHFSEGVAFIKQTDGPETNGTDTFVSENVPFDLSFDSGFRAFIGYSFDCGGTLKFTYWNFDDGATESGVSTGDFLNGNGVAFVGHGQTAADIAGDTITARMGIKLNVFDIEYSKRFDFSELANSGCCPCQPRWDFSWSAGVRIANVEHTLDTQTSIPVYSEIEADFNGAGPRVSFEGRRYFGSGRWSLFGNLGASLLVGNYDLDITRTAPDPLVTTIDEFNTSTMRVIPVLDLELGLAWRPTCHTTLSTGYMVSAWGDLGMSEQIIGASGCCDDPISNLNETLDDANILAFDGIFVRVEHCF